MKKTLVVLAVAVLVPAFASAQRRVSANRASSGSRQSFKTTYNHAAPAQSSPAPRSFVTTSNHAAPAQASSHRGAPVRALRGGSPRGFSGGAYSPRRSQGSSWYSNYGQSRGLSRPRVSRRVDGGEGEGGAETGNGRTYLNTPGALIRTEGLGARVGPAEPARQHAVEGGSFVAGDSRYLQAQTNHQGLFVGPRDTPPNPSPGWGVTGNNSITPNTTIVNNNTSGNGNNNGHNNNGPGGGDD